MVSSAVRDARPPVLITLLVASLKGNYRWLGDTAFPLIATFYHYQFRMKKNLTPPGDWLKSSAYPETARKSKALRHLTNVILDTRKAFCKSISSPMTYPKLTPCRCQSSVI